MIQQDHLFLQCSLKQYGHPAMSLHGLCLKKVKLTVWNGSFLISFVSSNVGGQLGFKRHQVNDSNKDASWKQKIDPSFN